MKSSPDRGTDIETLLARLGGTAQRYADIQGREAGRRALAQWPLLAKLRATGLGDDQADTAALPDSPQ